MTTLDAILGLVQNQHQLDGTKDQIILDALNQVCDVAIHAAKAITDEAEAIFTQAETCRLDNDNDAYAVHVRIANYFSNHPNLSTLKIALPVIQKLLETLDGRAGRLLQLPSTKEKRQKAVKKYLAAAEKVEEFMKDLGPEFQFLPIKSGLAREQLEAIDQIMMADGKSRKSQAADLHEWIQKGRVEVGASFLRQADSGFGIPWAEAKGAFL